MLPAFSLRRILAPAPVAVVAVAYLTAASAVARAEDPPKAWSWQDRWTTALAPAADGKVVASLATGLPYREGSVVRFAVDKPEEVEELYKHPAAVWAVATSPDSATVASTDYQGTLAIKPLAGGEVKFFDKAFARWTRALAFSPDGKLLAAGNEAGAVFAWSLESGQVSATKDLASGQVFALAFSPSGNRLAVATGSGKLQVVNWPSLEPVKEIVVVDQPLWSVAFAGNDDLLWVGGADGVVRKVPLEGAAVEVGKLNDWVTALASTAGGGVIAVSLKGQIKRASHGGATSLSDWATGPNGIWDVMTVGDDLVVAATRKGGPAIFQTVGQLKYAAKESAEAQAGSK